MKNKNITKNIITIACAVSAFAITGCAASSSASVPSTVTVQSADNSGITVSGEEKIKATPDIAEITYSVYTQKDDAKTCQADNEKDLNAVLSLLKEKGVDDKNIQTNMTGLNPIYDWTNGKAITGYEMTTEVVVSSVPIDAAGIIVTDSVNAGINSISSVQYQCSDFDDLYQEALKNAISSARKKADIMAEAGGKKVSALTNVTELSSGNQPVAYNTYDTETAKMASTMNADTGENSTSLMPGQVDVEAEVSATFSIE